MNLVHYQAETTALTEAIAAILAGDIGMYTYATGQTTPALKQEWGVSEGSQQPTVTGIEVVVVVAANLQTPQTLDGYLWRTPWEVLIKQWDTEDTALRAYLKLQDGLIRLGYDLSPAVRSPRRSELDSIEQVRISVQRSCSVDLYSEL